MPSKESRAQTALEYLLLLGGVLLIVVLVIILLRANVFDAGARTIESNFQHWLGAVNASPTP